MSRNYQDGPSEGQFMLGFAVVFLYGIFLLGLGAAGVDRLISGAGFDPSRFGFAAKSAVLVLAPAVPAITIPAGIVLAALLAVASVEVVAWTLFYIGRIFSR